MLRTLAAVAVFLSLSCGERAAPRQMVPSPDRPDLPTECKAVPHRRHWTKPVRSWWDETIVNRDVEVAASEDVMFSVPQVKTGTSSLKVTIKNMGKEPIWVYAMFGVPFITRADEVQEGWHEDFSSIPTQCGTGSKYEVIAPGASMAADVWLEKNHRNFGYAGEPPPKFATGKIRFTADFVDHEPHDGCEATSVKRLFSDVVQVGQ